MQSISGRTYYYGQQIGSGTFGDVYTVFRDDNKEFAFKKFKRETPDLDLGILREISIMKIFQHNNIGIMNLEDIIALDDNEKTIGIIMKKYKIDLYDAIENKLLNKRDKRRITYKLLKMVHFLHINGVIHRDIKPENILLDDNKNPILADYTLAKVFQGMSIEGTHTSNIATVAYRAPEVINKKPYGFPVDAWSLGVIFYEMFTGSQLEVENDRDAVDFLSEQVVKIRNTPLGHIIKGLLIIDPKDRWTPEQALQSELFRSSSITEIIWKTIDKCKVTSYVNEICDDFEVEKNITRWASQIYVDRTNCSPHSAVELARKLYETELYYIDDEDYIEEEKLILIKMNYNLFI